MAYIPIRIPKVPSPVKDISIIGGATTGALLVLDSSGYIWGCGSNDYGGLGIFSTVSKSSFTPVINEQVSFTKLSSGDGAVCALDSSSYAWAWGYNTGGQLGLGNLTPSGTVLVPNQVSGGNQWQTVKGIIGSFSGLDSSSYAWAWGGSFSNSSPISILGGKQFTTLVSGYESFAALDISGFAWTWGGNTYGGLGNNTAATNYSSPISVIGGLAFSSITGADNSGYHFIAIDNSSYAWAWGYNNRGQIGDGTLINRSSPVSVLGSSWAKIFALGTNNVGFDSNSNCYIWGWAGTGGYNIDGSNISPISPYKTQCPFNPLKMLGSNYGYFSAMDTNSYVWAWGANTSSIFGGIMPSAISRPKYPAYRNQKYSTYQLSNINTFLLPAGGIILDSSSNTWLWGNNTYGQLGNNTTVDSSVPLSLTNTFRQILGRYNTGSPGATVIGLDFSSYAWAWGYNGYGGLGNNSSTNKSIPYSVCGGKQWIKVITAVDASYGIDISSYVWAWGYNTYGQLGNNTRTSYSSPISVIGGRLAVDIDVLHGYAAGYMDSVIMLDSNNYIWAWGFNSNGQLGNNSNSHASSPVSVVGGRQFSKITAGNGFFTALDMSSYAWAWGYNTTGQLAINEVGQVSSPTSVVGGRQFVALAKVTATNTANSMMAALDASSYAWTWGTNTAGILGDGTTFNKSSPVSVLGGYQYSFIGIDLGGFYGTIGNSYAVVSSQRYAIFQNGTATGSDNFSSPILMTWKNNYLLSPTPGNVTNLLGR